jgi:hypothetical protein
MQDMQLLLGLCIGIGLSAACGFRVFVPLLIMSIAAKTGHLTLAPAFQWIGSDIALWTFATATIIEIGAYYIPWLDHVLDLLATPVAIIAGIIITSSMVGGMDPYLKWTLAVIAGGGAAGLVHGATAFTRGASTATTGGLANPILATIELGLSFFTSVLAVVAPVAAIVFLALILLFLLLGAKKILLKFRRREAVAH